MAATSALLHAPRAVTRAPNGDLFIADTGNHRVRRVEAATGILTTVLGVGVVASSGDGSPALSFPVAAPAGIAVDENGNVFVSSTTTVRMLEADDAGSVDGHRGVRTIYGAAPRDIFPACATQCLTGVAVGDATTVHVVDSCAGMHVELKRVAANPSATLRR
jgi:hypothetical protein